MTVQLSQHTTQAEETNASTTEHVLTKIKINLYEYKYFSCLSPMIILKIDVVI